MAQVVIENPVLNSPYEEPSRHFYFDEDGITDKVVASRRLSSYFIPIAKPKKKGKQFELDTEWTKDRIEDTTVQDSREFAVLGKVSPSF
jgi:type III restriction enzyme